MYVCVSVVCVDRTRPRRRVYVRGTDRASCMFFLSPMRASTIDYTVYRVRMYGITVCIHRRPRPSRECIHSCVRVHGHGTIGDGWMGSRHACIHVVCRRRARRRTDSRDAPSATIDIVRIERLSRVSFPSLSRLDRSIRPTNSSHFIHSFIPLRPKGRAHARTNERTEGRRAREGRDRRETRDPRRETRPFASRAEREVRASRTHDASNRAFIACAHFKPPTGDDRARIAMNAMKRAKRSSD